MALNKALTLYFFIVCKKVIVTKNFGAPGRIRTYDQLVMS